MLFLFAATIGILILAVSLPGLTFQKGAPVPGAATAEVVGENISQGTQPRTFMLPWLTQAVLAFGILILLVAAGRALIRKQNLRRIGLLVGGLAILFLVFSQLPALPHVVSGPSQPETSKIEATTSSYQVAVIGQPPATLFRWVAAGLIAAGAGLAAWLLVRASDPRPADPLAGEMEAAIHAIQAGQSLNNIILRCYVNMETLVAQETGLLRGESLTPREFERALKARGIPVTPLQQLTRLFEKARYSNMPLGTEDEHQALSCLSAIQTACQTGLKGKP